MLEGEEPGRPTEGVRYIWTKETRVFRNFKWGDLKFHTRAVYDLWVKPKRASEKAVLVSKYDRGKWGQYFVQLQRIGDSDEMEVFSIRG